MAKNKESLEDRVVGGNQSLDSICAVYCSNDKACYMSVMCCPYYVDGVGRRFKYDSTDGDGD